MKQSQYWGLHVCLCFCNTCLPNQKAIAADEAVSIGSLADVHFGEHAAHKSPNGARDACDDAKDKRGFSHRPRFRKPLRLAENIGRRPLSQRTRRERHGRVASCRPCKRLDPENIF